MTKRIFQSICLAALGVFFASALLFLRVLYRYFSDVQKGQLRVQAELAARGTAGEGLGYLEGLGGEGYRITWIDRDGTVLYDSRTESAEMENHLEREEIVQAFARGMGESTRYSMTLLERSIYCAQRLPDGTVLRISCAQSTPLTLILEMSQPICIIFAVAALLSLGLALKLSREIVRPLNELNLDDPLGREGYDELAPLLNRLAAQQRRIRGQEEELRRRQSEFQAVTTGMAEGIILLNEKKVILSINPAAARLFGTDASCVGRYLSAVSRSLALQELLQRAGEGSHGEMLMELYGGTYQLDASPVSADGLVSGVVLLLLNVTGKEKAERMRREFTANVSHELKTPLHTISGSAELLAGGLVRQEDIPGFAGRIYAEAQRMICLVEDIIKLSHLDEGASDLKREEVELYALAEETARALLPRAQEAGVEIALKGEPVLVYGIRQLLEGIVYNLCDNAIKYNKKEGSVSVTVQREGRGAVLAVADTGIGIPPECQERVFERFYRVDKSHSKEIGGTGLGLSIVKHAAKLHDASVGVKSRPGEGTVVTVRFPPQGPASGE